MNENLIKVAYGIGCIERLVERGVNPAAFVESAADSTDTRAKIAADAMLAVAYFANAEPQVTEKIAATITKTARMRAIERPLSGITDAVGAAARRVGDAAEGIGQSGRRVFEAGAEGVREMPAPSALKQQLDNDPFGAAAMKAFLTGGADDANAARKMVGAAPEAAGTTAKKIKGQAPVNVTEGAPVMGSGQKAVTMGDKDMGKLQGQANLGRMAPWLIPGAAGLGAGGAAAAYEMKDDPGTLEGLARRFGV